MSDKTGQQLADEGIQKALDNANEEWKEAARSAVRILCRKRGVDGMFSADAVNAIIAKTTASTHTKKAMGGIFKTMCSEGWIEHSDDGCWDNLGV